MKIQRRFTQPGVNVFDTVACERRTSRISNPDGSVVFEMNDAEIPAEWSQLATDIMVSKYFRKAGVPVVDPATKGPLKGADGHVVTGPEKSAKQVINRLAGCWRHWGETHGYFDTPEDAQAFYDELAHMLLHQMCAPNSPQWFNTGLNWAYGITGPAQGHFYCDPATGELTKGADAYTHPQPHACFIQSVRDDLVGDGGIMDLWVREARLFKYGSGTGSNFSKLRGENEPLSGGGKSSGLMSFLKIGDRAAGAIKSGGTTRRAAKMVCLDLDHPDIESFVNWKVREELKVAALAEGIKRLPADQQEIARRLNLKLDYDFNGEAYYTVSGQNSNNSVRINNAFFKAVAQDGDWVLTRRTDGKISKTLKARDLWDQIAFAAWRCADPGVQYDDTINQWHTCPNSGRINASNPCITGDTRVLTPGGIWRRIDQMIHLPARVVTNLDGQSVHVTEGSFPTGTRDVYELRTRGCYALKLTADHKVWTRTRGWVAAKDLTTDDDVKLPSQPACVNEIGEPQDARFFHLVGLLLSDANNNVNALHLDRCLPPGAQADGYARYAAENWAERPYSNDYVISDMLSGDGIAGASGDTLTATVTNRRLLSRAHAYIRTDHAHRRLTEDAFTAGLAAQKHLLRGLFTADGILVNNTLELRGESLGLLQDVQLLLLGFGVQTHLEPAGSSFILHLPSFDETGQDGSSATGGLPGRRAELGLAADDPTGRRRGDSCPPTRGGVEAKRHGLRIDPGSLRSFSTHVGLLPGTMLEQLAHLVARAIAPIDQASQLRTHFAAEGNWDRVATLRHLGKRQVFDLTEPVTSSFVANGLTVHNCSEYMFLDDTACNLASLNVLTFFDAGSRSFDVEGYKHAIRLWTIVLEISVLMASFPSESIARLSYKFRTLGLGYANLGAMLMQAGIPYDSDKGRAVCAALTSILTGESYAASAEMARQLGAFAGFDENAQDMLRVMRNHRRAAYDVGRRSDEATNEGRSDAATNGGRSDEATKARSDEGKGEPNLSPSSLRRSVASSPDSSSPGSSSLGSYEKLDIQPVGIDAAQFADANPMAPKSLLHAARECWDRALQLGEQHGYRNAQTTVIAPTGTIGLLMDCDTTGVEPDFALMKFKKLAGGGYFKIANQSLPPALGNLGYSGEQVHEILQYVMGTLTLHGAPHVSYDRLRTLGLTDAELEKVERALPGTFEIGFAFSPWTLGAGVMARLGVAESEWQAPNFSLLRKLGFTRRQIDEANDVICGRGTVEGAPHMRDEHLPVFDCANKCGKTGRRFIHVDGHIKMMAAAQPFISGAISKTINLPNEATVADIKGSYELSWKLGLKANALYRDGSKLSQPLNVKSDEDLENTTDAEDEEAVEAAKDEVASDVARAAAVVSCDPSAIRNPQSAISSDSALSTRHSALSSDNLSAVPVHTIEKIIERIVERPLRRRLPDTRRALTHKFDVAGHEGYITAGLYDDGQPGEVFIRIAKEGSTIGGLMDTIATLVSVSLQYGVPVESLVRKFEHVRFEPSGMTRNADIPIAKSLVDYIFRYLAMEFVPGYRAANAPQRPGKQKPEATLQKVDAAVALSPRESKVESLDSLSTQHSALSTPSAPSTPEATRSGNGHGPRMEADTAQPFDYDATATHPGTGLDPAQAQDPHAIAPDPGSHPSPTLRLAIVADPLSQQGSNMQADAPACDVCGSITVRSGTCYKCLNCGNSMGCS